MIKTQVEETSQISAQKANLCLKHLRDLKYRHLPDSYIDASLFLVLSIIYVQESLLSTKSCHCQMEKAPFRCFYGSVCLREGFM